MVDKAIETALREAFTETDAKLKKDVSIDAELSGTTAVACLCIHNKATGKTALYTANAGDSRAILQPVEGTATVDLTDDQKPDTPAEMRLIPQKGGHVSPPEEEWGG